MNISLRNFTQTDLPLLKQWRDNIEAEQYMSRFEPFAFTQTNIMQSYLSAWYIIQLEDTPVGTVWFEKQSIDDNAVQLGILLGDKKYFGKGIGSEAMELGIKSASIRLDFSCVQLNVRKSNKRAIAVYKKFGFTQIDEGVKEIPGEENIPYISMEYHLPDQINS